MVKSPTKCSSYKNAELQITTKAKNLSCCQSEQGNSHNGGLHYTQCSFFFFHRQAPEQKLARVVMKNMDIMILVIYFQLPEVKILSFELLKATK
jgi:hypothetical protein